MFKVEMEMVRMEKRDTTDTGKVLPSLFPFFLLQTFKHLLGLGHDARC